MNLKGISLSQGLKRLRTVCFYLHNALEITKLDMENRFLVTRDQGKKKGWMWHRGSFMDQIVDFDCGDHHLKLHT